MTQIRTDGCRSVAIVHDYFTQRGGAERVAEWLTKRYPDSRLYTSVMDPGAAPASVDPGRIRMTPLQRLREAGVPLKALAPVLPTMFARLDLGSPDLVVSSSSAFAHHVRPGPRAVHICYCHTPASFLWEPREYFRTQRAVGRTAAPPLAIMRRWDRSAARRVDVYIANSSFTADRIRANYGREARVIYPPIDTAYFAPSDERSGRFLLVARLRPHKALDLAITAANELHLPIDVIGEGSDRSRLEAMAGPTVRFLGRRTDSDVAMALARCVALVVPGIEDFGMTTAEVQAAGRPPVALDAGGTPEIVRDGQTGFLVAQRTALAFGRAMLRAQREELDPRALVASARRFDSSVFDRAIGLVVETAFAYRQQARLSPIMAASSPAAMGK